MVVLKARETFNRFKALCNLPYFTQQLWIWPRRHFSLSKDLSDLSYWSWKNCSSFFFTCDVRCITDMPVLLAERWWQLCYWRRELETHGWKVQNKAKSWASFFFTTGGTAEQNSECMQPHICCVLCILCICCNALVVSEVQGHRGKAGRLSCCRGQPEVECCQGAQQLAQPASQKLLLFEEPP